MKPPLTSNQTELTQEDLQLIAATVTMMQRHLSQGLAQRFAMEFLSESPQFTFAEIEILCAALHAMSRQIGKDRKLPRSQIVLVQQRAAIIIQKFERGMKYERYTKAV